MYWQLIAYIAISIISSMLAPKPPSPKPQQLDDSDVPIAEPGEAIPVVFGTVTLTGSNVVWWGDTGTTSIRSSGGKK